MESSRSERHKIRLEGAVALLLLLSALTLAAWLSLRYSLQWDLTASGRHSLTETTVALLESLEGPIQITSFSRKDGINELRRRTSEVVERYRQHKGDIALTFVDPDMAPDQVAEQGITLEGELVIAYQGRRENLRTIGEQALTNTLQRLARASQRQILFVHGHGERTPHGIANHDLSDWVGRLQAKGIASEGLNLAVTPTIPTTTALLVIASPGSSYLPGETEQIVDYLRAGGNLLWLSDPSESMYGLEALADELGISFLPGTIVDDTSQLLGIDNPAFIVIPEYPQHPITNGLQTLTLFPLAHGISTLDTGEWQGVAILRTLSRAWAESSPIKGILSYSEGEDLPGPLPIGIALQRTPPKETESDVPPEHHGVAVQEAGQQRIVVVGDSDFLSNRYLGNGANIELGERLINWLSEDDRLIAISRPSQDDSRLEISKTLAAVIGIGFLFLLPFGVLSTGLFLWYRRKRL